MATAPAQPMEATGATTLDSLNDDNIEEILLRLPSPASLARAALSSRRWRRVASSADFLRRFRERHPSPPVLGLFVSQTDLGQLPVFHPSASVRSDPDLAAAARGGDFLLTRLGHDPAWRLRDCRNGRLLLCRGDFLSVYDPVSHQHLAVCRRRTNHSPRREYMSDCLLQGEDGEAASFRLVSVQRDGQWLRPMEYRSCTLEWRRHPWADGIDEPTLHTPAMPAAASGLIFWRCDKSSSLLLDTSTMTFSTVPLPAPLVILWNHPLRSRPVYAIGDTQAGECCLVSNIGRAMFQVWLLKKNNNIGHAWELEKQGQIGEIDSFNRQLRVHMVAAGLALVFCMCGKYSHIIIDLKNLSLKDKFLCHRSMPYPYQMPWPPASLVATSTSDRSNHQTYACGDAEKHQEAPSSSRKHKSENKVSSGLERMEPCISIASLENETSEKKFCYEIGPVS